MYVIRTTEDLPRYLVRERKGVSWTSELDHATPFGSYAHAAAILPRGVGCEVVTRSEAATFKPPVWSSTIEG